MSSVSESYNDIIERYKKECPRGTALVCACEKGRVEDVEDIIRGARATGMDVTAMVSKLGTNSHGASSLTPLMIAAWYEHSTIIEILIKNGANTATTNNIGINALEVAAWSSKTTTTIVGLLLDNMELEAINNKDKDGVTPLDSCYYNTSPIKQQLIDLVRQKGGKRASELAEAERITRIRLLSNERKTKLYNDLINKYEEEFSKGTALVCACEKGRVEDVATLIEGARAAGMDVTAMVSKVGTDSYGDSMTPLIAAAWYEHSTIIEILLQCNADTATTNYGYNALHYAAYNNKTTTTTVRLLLNNMQPEDINHKNIHGNTPLDYCYINNSSIKQQLIDLVRQKGGKRASELAEAERITRIRLLSKEEKEKLYKTLNEKYKKEFPFGTALVCACEKGRVEDVGAMIIGARAAGMDVTAMVSEEGRTSIGTSWTPLMTAAWYERSTIIEILLQYNADTATADNDDGQNALHQAARNTTNTTTVRLLLNNMKLEAINHKDKYGNTPLDRCYYNDSSIKQQLIDLIRRKGGKRAMELPAMLGKFYTLDRFRTQLFPIEANRLTFTVPGKDVDCDVGDYETTKYMPVKLEVESEDEDDGGEESENNWDKDGDDKLFLFCAKELKQYLNTQQGFYGLSTETANIFFEGDLSNQNPFNKKIIIGVQYLTQAEIEKEQKKYAQLNLENNNVEDNRKKIEENNNKKAYADSMELLANNPLLSILQRRLENARRLLAEEEAKDTANMTEREEELRNVEIVGARNRILDLEQRIRREEEKEEQRRLEELKRKNSLPVGLKNKRQRKKLYLKLSNLKF